MQTQTLINILRNRIVASQDNPTEVMFLAEVVNRLEKLYKIECEEDAKNGGGK